jgi:hypothetical protein
VLLTLGEVRGLKVGEYRVRMNACTAHRAPRSPEYTSGALVCFSGSHSTHLPELAFSDSRPISGMNASAAFQVDAGAPGIENRMTGSPGDVRSIMTFPHTGVVTGSYHSWFFFSEYISTKGGRLLKDNPSHRAVLH